MNEPLLLLIDAADAQVLQDALTLFANECDRTGVPTDESARADRLWERLNALGDLCHLEAREVVKAMGMGRYRGRPQG